MRKNIFFLIGLVVFACLCVASIVWESPVILYIASAVPMLIMPWFPDFQTTKRIRVYGKGVHVLRTVDEQGVPDSLILTIAPRAVNWNRRRNLVLLPGSIPTVAALQPEQQMQVIDVPAAHLFVRKDGAVGIHLAPLRAQLVAARGPIRFIIACSELEAAVQPAQTAPVAPQVEMSA